MTPPPKTPTRADLIQLLAYLGMRAQVIVTERNRAYAGNGDVFGNLNLVETLSNGKLSTEVGIILRMGDKVSRLFSLCSDTTIDPGAEKLEDTIIDLIGYGALLLLRHNTRNPPCPVTPPNFPSPSEPAAASPS